MALRARLERAYLEAIEGAFGGRSGTVVRVAPEAARFVRLKQMA